MPSSAASGPPTSGRCAPRSRRASWSAWARTRPLPPRTGAAASRPCCCARTRPTPPVGTSPRRGRAASRRARSPTCCVPGGDLHATHPHDVPDVLAEGTSPVREERRPTRWHPVAGNALAQPQDHRRSEHNRHRDFDAPSSHSNLGSHCRPFHVRPTRSSPVPGIGAMLLCASFSILNASRWRTATFASYWSSPGGSRTHARGCRQHGHRCDRATRHTSEGTVWHVHQGQVTPHPGWKRHHKPLGSEVPVTVALPLLVLRYGCVSTMPRQPGSDFGSPHGALFTLPASSRTCVLRRPSRVVH